MGILNITPDSFSDGGKFLDVNKACERALQMAAEGADIIDIGGESTGPGSQNVSLQEEIKRVIPVIEKVRGKINLPISIDTYKHQVALHALNIGADMVNDVTAMRGDGEMAKILAEYDVPVVLMYAKDQTPRTTTESFKYNDVMATVKTFLRERIEYGMQAGIKRDRFIIDPGMGAFVSSDPRYSLEILRRLNELPELELPILIGASRKSFIGKTLDLPAGQRLEGGLACAAIAVLHGASIIRTHDVKETRRVIDMIDAIKKS
ncbi:dihydropteroate synthase [Patescibacteria group bacterium]|nr:dihydropteroate synthase [Patescibacteria group bacterium]MBU1703390.1 dihydropteroate synthase [Patescibacteria group bacterium]MBU1953904.1 dihydropteroate synthase [Patescibacteria group bacterium]